MSCGTTVLPFRVEVYVKAGTTHNNAGQPVRDYELDRLTDCDFMPSRAEERLVGRQQNPLSYNITVSGHDDDIEVDMQLRNLQDKLGNIIEEGPFNIVGVRKHAGWSTIDHITLNAQAILR